MRLFPSLHLRQDAQHLHAHLDVHSLEQIVAEYGDPKMIDLNVLLGLQHVLAQFFKVEDGFEVVEGAAAEQGTFACLADHFVVESMHSAGQIVVDAVVCGYLYDGRGFEITFGVVHCVVHPTDFLSHQRFVISGLGRLLLNFSHCRRRTSGGEQHAFEYCVDVGRQSATKDRLHLDGDDSIHRRPYLIKVFKLAHRVV
jgi:hypothetical protein